LTPSITKKNYWSKPIRDSLKRKSLFLFLSIISAGFFHRDTKKNNKSHRSIQGSRLVLGVGGAKNFAESLNFFRRKSIFLYTGFSQKYRLSAKFFAEKIFIFTRNLMKKILTFWKNSTECIPTFRDKIGRKCIIFLREIWQKPYSFSARISVEIILAFCEKFGRRNIHFLREI
jgi:hypothetical protein